DHRGRVHHRDDLLLAGDRAAGGRQHRRAGLSGRPGGRSRVRVFVHVQHAARRRPLRLARPADPARGGASVTNPGATSAAILALTEQPPVDDALDRPRRRRRANARVVIGGTLIAVLILAALGAPILAP